MIKKAFILLFSLLALLVNAQSNEYEIRVVKHYGLSITPDTPYLLNGVKYKFIITGKKKEDEIMVNIDKGKVSLTDTILTLTPHYTKGENRSGSDTTTLTIRLRDAHQADIGTFKVKYKVYSPPTRRQFQNWTRVWNPGARGTFLFWKGILADSINTPEKVLACLDGEFTYSRYMNKDSPRYKFSSIIMNRETFYHPYLTMGTKLSELMIDAIRNEKDGCRFIVEFNYATTFGPRGWRFDTRKGQLIVKRK